MRKALKGSLIAVTFSLTAVALVQNPLPQGPGADLVYAKCRACHDIYYLTESAGIPRGAWVLTVMEMEEMGLEITDEEREIILNYLSESMSAKPQPQPADATSAPASTARSVSGVELYRDYCAACHQENGKGQPPRAPPLAGNTILTKDRRYPLLVMLNGLRGEIEVGARRVNNIMPGWSQFDDAEIAAIINYIVTAWGNDKLLPEDFEPISDQEVGRARGQPLTPRQVWQYRNDLR